MVERFDCMFYWKVINFILFIEFELFVKEELKFKLLEKVKKKVNNGN